MSNQLKNKIAELLDESRRFNTNDVLVHVDTEHKKLVFQPDSLTFSTGTFPQAILREAQKTLKESGVNSLCITEGIVRLKRGNNFVNAPLLITPLEWRTDKVREDISFQPQDDVAFLNPFVESELKKLDIISETKHDFESLKVLLTNSGLEVEDTRIIGNFHHHRFEILKELEELLDADSLSENIHELFGENREQTASSLKLPNDILFPADVDHESVFDAVEKGDTVIQGPPGTGKSQVLTNLVAKLLKEEKTTVVLSEKRVALEVIEKKLSTFGLDRLCFIASSDLLSHSFLQELKNTWDYFESYDFKPVNILRLSEQYEANLQMTLDLLKQDDLIGGVSFHTFLELCEGTHPEKYPYSSRVTSVSHFLEHKTVIQEIYDLKIHASIGHMKSETLKNDQLHLLDRSVASWKQDIEVLNKDFELTDWGALTAQMKSAAMCQIFENDLYKRYAPIFKPNSRPQQQFLSLRKKFIKARTEVDRIQSNQSQWNTVPSEAETLVLIDTFEKGGFFSKMHAKKRWKTLSDLHVSKAPELLQQHLSDIEKINTLSQLVIKFCELGIENPEIDVPLVYQTLLLYSEEQWQQLAEIPSEDRLRMTEHHSRLEAFYSGLKKYFVLDDAIELNSFLDQMLKDLPKLISGKERYELLDSDCLHALSRNASFKAFEGELLNSHLTQFRERFPNYSKFEVQQLHDKVADVLRSQQEEASLFAREIENQVFKAFERFHELLNTPARKLSEDEKQLKTRLRKGKSLLVKEFGKSRSHPSLRELFNSEAREWIQLLKPIWLSNPAQLSKCFPMSQHLFDVAIFDEASQIPLQNALGAIQRSERIVVAGDEHQMGPSSYFQSGNTEILDVLHQANYNWKRVELKHHYRSAHPQLIAFSNKHFYRDELKAFPAYNVKQPIVHHFVENGTFIERKNEEEAKAMSALITNAVKDCRSLGIVAFSEEQLNCIYSALPDQTKLQLNERLDDNTAFFKSLENVQGDECDHLIISFGYGRNEDGEFHMRFGPMNTSNGRRRLNVLLTRAIQQIDFFCSVRSSDFKISENESINLLRQWISTSEQQHEEETIELPFQFNTAINKNEIDINRIQETLSEAREVVTLQNVLEHRGWHVHYS